MSDKPNAHLWFGTEATDEHPWVTKYEYDDNDNEIVTEPDEDSHDAQQRIERVYRIHVVSLINGDDEDGKFALAIKYRCTDWDAELGIDAGELGVPSAEEQAVFLKICKDVGWPEISLSSLKWRLGASYF